MAKKKVPIYKTPNKSRVLGSTPTTAFLKLDIIVVDFGKLHNLS